MPIDAITDVKWSRAPEISARNPIDPVSQFEAVDEDFNPIPDLPKPVENPLQHADRFERGEQVEGIVSRSSLARLFDFDRGQGSDQYLPGRSDGSRLVKFKGQEFVSHRPKHVGPAHHPEQKEGIKHQEQEQHERHVEAKDPIENGPAGDEHGDERPAEDGSGPTGPRSRDLRPAEDGSGPVGPRSHLGPTTALRSTAAVSYRAIASAFVR